MLNLLTLIFTSNNYQVSVIENGLVGFNAKLAMPRDKESKQEYFLILQHDDINDDVIEKTLAETSSTFFDILDSLDITDESFRKNCTMILCCENGRVSNRNILMFEEDPLIFKKNILIYSQEELNSLVEIIGEEKPTSIYFNDLINSSKGEVFESFKKNQLDMGNRFYPLLMRVVTKLPIVHYISNETELEDLGKLVRKKFTEDENELLDSIMRFDLSVNELETAFFDKWK